MSKTQQAAPLAYGEAYRQAVLADAPLGFWRLSDKSGSVALDWSGYGRHGAYIASPTQGSAGLLAGTPHTSVTLNGTTQFVSVPFGAWMNTGNTYSAEAVIRSVSTPGAIAIGRRDYSSGGPDVFSLRNTGSGSTIAQTSYLVDEASLQGVPQTVGVTRHLVQTYDGSRVKLYCNGRLKFDRLLGYAVAQPGSGDITLGCVRSFGNAVELSDGRIQECAFYGTTLSAARIRAHALAAGLADSLDTRDNAAASARVQMSLQAVNGYTGAMLDVRRDSDSATRTIGVASGQLDTADLLTWAGAASVFVSKWYDMSGNAHHWTQATAALQPRIVNAGTLDTVNGKPVIYCVPGTGQYLEEPSAIGDADTCTILVIGSAGYGRGADGSGSGWSILMVNGSEVGVVFTSGGTAYFGSGGNFTSAFEARCGRIVNAAGAGYVVLDSDGYQRSQLSTGASNLRSSGVGNRIGRSILLNDPSYYFPGPVGEIFIWRSIVDHGVQQAIVNAAKTRFGF